MSKLTCGGTWGLRNMHLVVETLCRDRLFLGAARFFAVTMILGPTLAALLSPPDLELYLVAAIDILLGVYILAKLKRF